MKGVYIAGEPAPSLCRDSPPVFRTHFQGRMIIRCDSDGKKYLYDIIDIKKKRSTPLRLKAVRHKTTFPFHDNTGKPTICQEGFGITVFFD